MTEMKSRIDGPVKVVMWVAGAVTVMMLLHITLDVFLRQVFNAPIIGTFEVAANYYMVSVMYLPLAYVSLTEGQIVVELFTRGFGKKTLIHWDNVANAITVVNVMIFAFYTGDMAIEQTVTGEVMEMDDDFMPVWPARWMLPIAFGMMGLYLMVRIRQDAGRAREIKVPISA
jgi:TRAP-type C4-dicarboxylate transport system permease small subunit